MSNTSAFCQRSLRLGEISILHSFAVVHKNAHFLSFKVLNSAIAAGSPSQHAALLLPIPKQSIWILFAFVSFPLSRAPTLPALILPRFQKPRRLGRSAVVYRFHFLSDCILKMAPAHTPSLFHVGFHCVLTLGRGLGGREGDLQSQAE